MMRFVLDSSFTMAWAFPEERTGRVESVLNDLLDERAEALTSPLWFYEVTNVLIVGERRKRLTQIQSAKFVELLESLPINISDAPLSDVFSEAAALARQYTLSAYDASYLRIAIEEGLPLATLDSAMQKAAASAGVAVLGAK